MKGRAINKKDFFELVNECAKFGRSNNLLDADEVRAIVDFLEEPRIDIQPNIKLLNKAIENLKQCIKRGLEYEDSAKAVILDMGISEKTFFLWKNARLIYLFNPLDKGKEYSLKSLLAQLEDVRDAKITGDTE